MNPRSMAYPIQVTKAERVHRRRLRMKSLVAMGYSRVHAFKIAKEQIK